MTQKDYMLQLASAVSNGANYPRPELLADMAMEWRREFVEENGEPRSDEDRRELFACIMVKFWEHGMTLMPKGEELALW